VARAGEEGWRDFARLPLHAPNARHQLHHSDSAPTGLTVLLLLVFLESGIKIVDADENKLGRIWFYQPLQRIAHFAARLLRRGDWWVGALGNVCFFKDKVWSLSVDGEAEIR
jgi:hypothetical protein